MSLQHLGLDEAFEGGVDVGEFRSGALFDKRRGGGLVDLFRQRREHDFRSRIHIERRADRQRDRDTAPI